VILRPALPVDLDAIAAIQAASPEASQWNPADYLNYTCWVAERDGVCGFLATREVAPGENEVLNLAVDPAARRSGVAKALLQNAIEATPGDWFLEVRESNQSAISLYENAGFRACGARPGYYENSGESAIVMVRQK
jgi:ribosomal-protein-alanine N-acetyltransferase